MAYETHSIAPILLRPRNFLWYFNSAADPWLGVEEWQQYTNVENEIIEDAQNENEATAEIDGGYMIDLEYLLQYNKLDSSNARQIKRVELDKNRSKDCDRERFSLPIILSTTKTTTNSFPQRGNIYDKLHVLGHYGNLSKAYQELKPKTSADVVEEAAQGIIKEGTALSKPHKAQWLAQQLLAVKHFGNSHEPGYPVPPVIGETCVHLYTKESFLYKPINRVLRNSKAITSEQVKTLGPFFNLLHVHLYNGDTTDKQTVYRSSNLTDEEREEFMKDKVTFRSFTSTTSNREVAEFYDGNTLLIIDLNVISKDYLKVRNGTNISSLSEFPEEEEILIWPDTHYHFVKYEYDRTKKKHIIYLRCSERNDR